MDEQHSLVIHGLQAAEGCNSDWQGMKGAGRVRRCNTCKMRVIDVEGLTERDRDTLLYIQGIKNSTDGKVYRRADRRFVAGNCREKRTGNRAAMTACALAPFASYALIPHISTLLLNPANVAVFVPFYFWAAIGASIVSRVKSATIVGILFTIFTIPAMLGPFIVFLAARSH